MKLPHEECGKCQEREGEQTKVFPFARGFHKFLMKIRCLRCNRRDDDHHNDDG